MHHLRLLFVSVVAILAVFLQCQSQTEAAAAAAFDPLDVLKSQLMPAEFRGRNLTVDEFKKVLRKKCKKAAGGRENSTLYQEVEKGITVLPSCFTGLANMATLQAEMEAARPIGELDTVFNKYCNKTPEATKCLRAFNDKVRPCLSVKEKQQNEVLMRIVKGLIEFMCARGGDHLALFVAEEGPECLEANREAINMCLNSSFHEFLPKHVKVPDFFDMPDLILDPDHCVGLERFQACTIRHLEQCREITAANIAASVFKFVKNETSCNEYLIAKANERPILIKANSMGGGGAAIQGVSGLRMLLDSGVMFLVSYLLRM